MIQMVESTTKPIRGGSMRQLDCCRMAMRRAMSLRIRRSTIARRCSSSICVSAAVHRSTDLCLRDLSLSELREATATMRALKTPAAGAIWMRKSNTARPSVCSLRRESAHGVSSVGQFRLAMVSAVCRSCSGTLKLACVRWTRAVPATVGAAADTAAPRSQTPFILTTSGVRLSAADVCESPPRFRPRTTDLGSSAGALHTISQVERRTADSTKLTPGERPWTLNSQGPSHQLSKHRDSNDVGSRLPRRLI